MTLKGLLAKGQLRRHETSAKETAEFLKMTDRDIADAQATQISADGRFTRAYNAALGLATIALHAAGYRASGAGHHWVTFHVLPEIMGAQAQVRADYLDNCRSKRNTIDYGRAGAVSAAEVQAILKEVKSFRADVLVWLKAQHPALLPRRTK